jgi:hypothetical protein
MATTILPASIAGWALYRYRSTMYENLSPQQARERHVAVMGEALGTVFHELHDDFYLLQSKWQEYVELFGRRETVDLLNAAAPDFFYLVDGVLWEDILLHVARLTDPASTGRGRGQKQNLSFGALPALVPDETLKDDLKPLIAAATDSAGFARDWRHRRLAHRDLPLAIGTAEPLAPASRLLVEQAVEKLFVVLRTVHLRFFDSDLQREVLPMGTGAGRLLAILREGVRAERDRYDL